MRVLTVLALLLLGACSSISGSAEAPACSGEVTPFLPELWQAPDNALPPGSPAARRRRS